MGYYLIDIFSRHIFITHFRTLRVTTNHYLWPSITQVAKNHVYLSDIVFPPYCITLLLTLWVTAIQQVVRRSLLPKWYLFRDIFVFVYHFPDIMSYYNPRFTTIKVVLRSLYNLYLHSSFIRERVNFHIYGK